MVLFEREGNICQRKAGELAKLFLMLLGVPNKLCPFGNITHCYNEKDNYLMTSTRKVISLFTKSSFEIETRIQHDTGESCFNSVIEIFKV